jgi:hypothetical protein
VFLNISMVLPLALLSQAVQHCFVSIGLEPMRSPR